MTTNSAAPRRRPHDDVTRRIPAVPNAVRNPDQTQVIPSCRRPPAGGRSVPRWTKQLSSRAVIHGDDATAVIPAVRPDRPWADLDREGGSVETPHRARRKDDTGFLKFGRVRAYDSEPGDLAYRGRHSDIVPLTEASPARKIFHGVGEVMITFGLVLLLFAGVRDLGQGGHRRQPPGRPRRPAGAGVGRRRSDRRGTARDPSAERPTQAGAAADPTRRHARPALPARDWASTGWSSRASSRQDIEYAPGHYPDSALPGEVGNFSVAGHRSPAIFWDLDKMRTGDPIVVETRTTFFVYCVTSLAIVHPPRWRWSRRYPDSPVRPRPRRC